MVSVSCVFVFTSPCRGGMNLIPTRNESDEPCREDAGLDGTEEVLSSQGTAHALHSVPAVSPCPPASTEPVPLPCTAAPGARSGVAGLARRGTGAPGVGDLSILYFIPVSGKHQPCRNRMKNV